MDNILVLITGGTIDDLEYTDAADAPTGSTSMVPELLRQLGAADASSRALFYKDSQFMTDADRSEILRHIDASTEWRIVVTHGTKTMSETAKFLGPKVKGKTVVLTGCMVLPSRDGGKDARKELQFALEKVKSLPPGVYIAIQDTVFDWNNVRKNFEKSRFETER